MADMGTRTKNSVSDEHQSTRIPNAALSRDKGLAKRVVTAATFTAGNARVTGSNGDFTAFAAGDPIVIHGTNLNDGERQVTGIDGAAHAFLVLDGPPKNEGPVANVEVRLS